MNMGFVHNKLGVQLVKLKWIMLALFAAVGPARTMAQEQNLDVMCSFFAEWAGSVTPIEPLLASTWKGPGLLHVVDEGNNILYVSGQGSLLEGHVHRADFQARLQAEKSGIVGYPVSDSREFDIYVVNYRWSRCDVNGGAVTLVEQTRAPFARDESNPFSGRWLGAGTGWERRSDRHTGKVSQQRLAGSIKGLLFQDGPECGMDLFGMQGKWAVKGVIVSNHLRAVGTFLADEKQLVWTWNLFYEAEGDLIRGTLEAVGEGAHYDLSVFLDRYELPGQDAQTIRQAPPAEMPVEIPAEVASNVVQKLTQETLPVESVEEPVEGKSEREPEQEPEEDSKQTPSEISPPEAVPAPEEPVADEAEDNPVPAAEAEFLTVDELIHAADEDGELVVDGLDKLVEQLDPKVDLKAATDEDLESPREQEPLPLGEGSTDSLLDDFMKGQE